MLRRWFLGFSPNHDWSWLGGPGAWKKNLLLLRRWLSYWERNSKCRYLQRKRTAIPKERWQIGALESWMPRFWITSTRTRYCDYVCKEAPNRLGFRDRICACKSCLRLFESMSHSFFTGLEKHLRVAAVTSRAAEGLQVRIPSTLEPFMLGGLSLAVGVLFCFRNPVHSGFLG